MNRYNHWLEAERLGAIAERALINGEDEAGQAWATAALWHAVLASGSVPLHPDEDGDARPSPRPSPRPSGARPVPGPHLHPLPRPDAGEVPW